MGPMEKLLDYNKEWARRMEAEQPGFFKRLSNQQNPSYLWIGCSDSRVPANQIIGLMPGEVFVHRNVANIVNHSDLNCLSVVQYAVEVLKVKDIIVCGHYGCGGVTCALQNAKMGLIDNWLRNIQDVIRVHGSALDLISDQKKKLDTLCKLNVVEQVRNVSRTTILQDAWQRGQDVSVHGWIYGVHNGLIENLNVTIDGRNLPRLEEIIAGAASRVK